MPPTDDAYVETRVMTADPHALHLLVVDGALRNARRAVESLEKGDAELTHLALGEARDHVSELLGGLDEERGGEIAANVSQLFVFVFRTLLKAELESDVSAVRDAVRILELHRETWLELGETLRREQTKGATQGTGRVVPAPHLDGDLAAPREPREWTT